MAEVLIAFPLGFIVWFFTRYGLFGFYTIGPSERAVVTTFGRAQRIGEATTLEDPISETLRPDERDRYRYPQVQVVGPGFYWKLPWQRVHKVSIATVTVSIAYESDEPMRCTTRVSTKRCSRPCRKPRVARPGPAAGSVRQARS